MYRIKFPPPDKPWSTNQDRNLNPYDRHARIQAWKGPTALFAGMELKSLRGNPQPLLVTVTIPFTTNRRRDPHNYCGTVVKAIIDGLVLAEVVPDDTPEWIGHREPHLVKGGDVIVDLEPLIPVPGSGS